MLAVDPEMVDTITCVVPPGWKDGQARTRPHRLAAMQRRPGKWWHKVDALAGQRKHKGFRRACVYLLELRAVVEPDVFMRRLARFRRDQRRKRDLIAFLNEAGLTVPGEPVTWEALLEAYPLGVRQPMERDEWFDSYLEDHEPLIETEWNDEEIPF